MAESTPKDALKGWKSIADYFGRDTSTVMRWAAQRGLPVRRLPGDGRSSVYAVPGELAAWLATSETQPAVETPPAPEPPLVASSATPPPTAALLSHLKSDTSVKPAGRRKAFAAVGLAAGVIAVTAAAFSLRSPATAEPHPAFRSAAAEQAYLAATYDLDLRTPASLDRAISAYGRIIARDPAAAPAYASLAEAYLLLREYSAFPSAEAYRRAAAAAKAAIALDPDLMAAHRARAFVAFWSDHDIATARAEFARARALNPHDAQTWHWYATALSANGEAAAALDAIAEARRLDPQSTPIAADYGLLAYLAGNREDGLAALHAVAAGAPGHMSAHRYLADLALARGDGATYLDESAIACRLKNDALEGKALVADRAAFAAGGQHALLASIATRLAGRETAGGDHFALAKIAALQGRTAVAIDQLRLAVAAHETSVAVLPGEIMLQTLAGDPAFEALKPRGSLA